MAHPLLRGDVTAGLFKSKADICVMQHAVLNFPKQKQMARLKFQVLSDCIVDQVESEYRSLADCL